MLLIVLHTLRATENFIVVVNLMSNKRKHPRIPMAVKVKIFHESFGEKIVKTRNISDSGLFLLAEPTELPSIGEIVTGMVQGMIDNPPVLNMKIVRAEKDGVGLQFFES